MEARRWSQREKDSILSVPSVVILSIFYLQDSGCLKAVPVILLCSVCEASLGFGIVLWPFLCELRHSPTGGTRCLIKDMTVLAYADTQHRGALRQL